MKYLVLITCAVILAGCQTAGGIGSVKGECGVFRDPGRIVQGKTRLDQRDIDGKWIEPGIAVCGFKRPTG
jgi:hypothetical protein